MRSVFNDDYPFEPKQCWFFYGWIIVVVATIGQMASIVGQTGGLTGFIEPLKAALGLGAMQLSVAYMIGTLCAAILLPWTGRLYDRLGARRLGVQVFIALGLVLFYMTVTYKIYGLFQRSTPSGAQSVAFILVTLGFFGLRYLGMGILGFLPRAMLSKWFFEKRGTVNAISGFCMALGSGCAPLLSSLLVEAVGWELGWQLVGSVFLLGFAPMVWFFYRDDPEPCGLRPDGRLLGSITNKPFPIAPTTSSDFSLYEAMRTRVFWVFAIGIALSSANATAINFHAQALESGYNLERNTFMELFIPISLLTVSCSTLTGWLSQRVPLKCLLIAMMGLGAIGAIGLVIAPHRIGFDCFVIGFGASFGMYSALNVITWPILFGKTHLGSISATAMGINLSATAFGPMLYSAALDIFGTYSSAFWLTATTSALIGLAAIWTHPPRKQMGTILPS